MNTMQADLAGWPLDDSPQSIFQMGCHLSAKIDSKSQSRSSDGGQQKEGDDQHNVGPQELFPSSEEDSDCEFSVDSDFSDYSDYDSDDYSECVSLAVLRARIII